MERRPPRVVWLYAPADRGLADDLLRFTALPERQGQMVNWHPALITPGTETRVEMERQINRADVLVVLLSPNFLADEYPWLEQAASRRVPLLPVLLRPTLIKGTPVDGLVPLPRSGKAISTAANRDAVLVEVIEGLLEVLRTLREEQARDAGAQTRPDSGEPAPPPSLGEVPLIEDIFPIHGVPAYTFVPPPDFMDIKDALVGRSIGLFVAGPSKSGKTTAVKKALEELKVPEAGRTWWQGTGLPAFDVFKGALDQLKAHPAGTPKRYLVIDDFHYVVDEQYLRALAFKLKELADSNRPRGMIVLIGTGPTGRRLFEIVRDLRGRVPQVHFNHVSNEQIAELIVSGEREARIRFGALRADITRAASGCFYIAQMLCRLAAREAGISVRQDDQVDVRVDVKILINKVRKQMREEGYHDPLLALACCDGGRGAGLSLLWLLSWTLSNTERSHVSFTEVKARFQLIQDAVDWLEQNLPTCFAKDAALGNFLHFDPVTRTVAVVDLGLRFYLGTLDWAAFAAESGHGGVAFDPANGPVWGKNGKPGNGGGSQGAAHETRAPYAEGAPVHLLHLSDLHFGSPAEARTFYGQLADDLRLRLSVDQLDAVVVSGDLTNSAVTAEFDAAQVFLEQLLSGFLRRPGQVVLVPGNHDQSWTESEAAYELRWRKQIEGPLIEGSYIPLSDGAVAIRNEERYRERFASFAAMYRRFKGEEYPLDPALQATLTDLPEAGLLLLGLNSAWQIDHHFKDRASIHPEALDMALRQLQPSQQAERLRIAVFHHPVSSHDPDHIKDDAFLQRLQLHGFRLVLHGHIHSAHNSLYHYHRGAQIDLISAGTFGAPDRARLGYPLQYNLLRIGRSQVTVETRRRDERQGAWQPDARWGDGDPRPRYDIPR